MMFCRWSGPDFFHSRATIVHVCRSSGQLTAIWLFTNLLWRPSGVSITTLIVLDIAYLCINLSSELTINVNELITPSMICAIHRPRVASRNRFVKGGLLKFMEYIMCWILSQCYYWLELASPYRFDVNRNVTSIVFQVVNLLPEFFCQRKMSMK